MGECIPLRLVPWGFAFFLLKQYRKPSVPTHRGDLAIVDALMATRNAIRAKRLGLKAVGVMYAVFLPLLALSIAQLYGAGKVSPRELVSMVIFMGGVCAASATCVILKYRSLPPRQEQLENVLRQFEQASAE